MWATTTSPFPSLENVGIKTHGAGDCRGLTAQSRSIRALSVFESEAHTAADGLLVGLR